METKVQSPVGNAIIYGLITGAAMIIFWLILILADLILKPGLQYLLYLVVAAGMIIGTLNYRNKVNGGFISYGNAFVSNFLIGLFSAILYMAFFFIYIQFINPAYIDQMKEFARVQMEQNSANLSEEQVDAAMSMQEKFMSPVMLLVFGLVGNLIFSTIIALIVAIFVKKKDESLQSTF